MIPLPKRRTDPELMDTLLQRRRLTLILSILLSLSFAAVSLISYLASRSTIQVALGDPMLCYSLFQNLLKNSCEAAPEGTAVTATIYPSAEAKPLRIAIDNKGAVPVSIRETFWEKYATAGKQEGTGIGTYSARLLTEAQNGTISMETSDDTNSTRIVVSLPA